jgi:dihydropyrimidinase
VWLLLMLDLWGLVGWVGGGWVVTGFCRGWFLMEGGAYVGGKGHGRYLRRGLSQYLL